MIFIKKSKKLYQLVSSCQCGFEPIFKDSCFDIVYSNKDLNQVILMFNSYVSRILGNGLY